MSLFKFGLIGKTPPGKLKDIFKHLTREKVKKPDLPEVFRASDAPIPPKKESIKTMEAINRFVRDNPRQSLLQQNQVQLEEHQVQKIMI